MLVKKVFPIFVLILGLTACSTLQKVVYRIDVPQGNYLEQVQVAKIKKGMTKAQVQYLLGTPALEDPFSGDHWYYVFIQRKAYEAPQQHTLLINFDRNGRITSFDLNKPLPKDPEAAVNNVIVSTKTIEPDNGWFSWL